MVLSTFGSFSGGASALLEATPLVARTQKYQSDQSALGVLGKQTWLEPWGYVRVAGQGDQVFMPGADRGSQSGVWFKVTPTCLSSGDWDSEEDGLSC